MQKQHTKSTSKSICEIKFSIPEGFDCKMLEVKWAKEISKKNQSEAY